MDCRTGGFSRKGLCFKRFHSLPIRIGKQVGKCVGIRFVVSLLGITALGTILVFWPVTSEQGRNLVFAAGKVTAPDSCEGRWIYVYNISTIFNQDLVSDCANLRQTTDPRNMNFCPYMENRGMGRAFLYGPEQGGPGSWANGSSVWFNSWQFSLEHYFHERFKTYPCVTESENEAKAFFVPFFTGMDVIRRISHHLARNKLHLELLEWLRTRSGWQRYGGLDHFLVLGRISSDFRRAEGSAWGNQMMFHADWQKMVKVTIERSSSKTAQFDNEIAVPYPTYYHAATDSQIRDLVTWMLSSSQRISLATFAGRGRPERLGDSVRKQVMRQCDSDSRCTSVLCADQTSANSETVQLEGFAGKTLHASCEDPPLLLSIFYRSIFCLQPPGDSPTRRSVFDSMLAGCIPVIFNKNSAWTQYVSHLPLDGESYSVFIPMDTVREQNVMNILESIPMHEVDSMRAKIAELLPRLLYAHVDRLYPFGPRRNGGQFLQVQDAFDVALKAVFTKIKSNVQLYTP